MGKDNIHYFLGSDNSRVADRLRHAAIIVGVGEDYEGVGLFIVFMPSQNIFSFQENAIGIYV